VGVGYAKSTAGRHKVCPYEGQGRGHPGGRPYGTGAGSKSVRCIGGLRLKAAMTEGGCPCRAGVSQSGPKALGGTKMQPRKRRPHFCGALRRASPDMRGDVRLAEARWSRSSEASHHRKRHHMGPSRFLYTRRKENLRAVCMAHKLGSTAPKAVASATLALRKQSGRGQDKIGPPEARVQ